MSFSTAVIRWLYSVTYMTVGLMAARKRGFRFFHRSLWKPGGRLRRKSILPLQIMIG